jgi:hypothetical protein
MRTSKLVLVLAFVSFAAMTFADNDRMGKAPTVKISLEKAMRIKSLKTEMLQQLIPDFLSVERPGLYYASVRYRNTTYVIYGKYEEWKLFFDLSRFRVINPNIELHPELLN